MQGLHTSISSCSQSLSSEMSKTSRRDDSDEIDVFNATRYFSGGIHGAGDLALPGAMTEERASWVGDSRSLDGSVRATRLPQQSKNVGNQCKDKKSKQPISPGGKLASFLNSFFKQTIYKKKSKPLTTTQPEKDASFEETQSGRRRSSMGYSQRMKMNDSNIMYCNSKSNGPQRYGPFCSQREAWCDKRVIGEVLMPAERAKSIDGYEEFIRKEDKWTRRREEEEDGGGSESSSDLFELKNYDLGWS